MHNQMRRLLFVPNYPMTCSSIELAALDVDSIFADSHAKILHGEDGASLTTALPTASVTWALDAEVVVFGFGAGVLAALSTSWCSSALWAAGRT
jgi:hypothetical protein